MTHVVEVFHNNSTSVGLPDQAKHFGMTFLAKITTCPSCAFSHWRFTLRCKASTTGHVASMIVMLLRWAVS